jgi:thiamine biosynthesis lipoprotein
MGITRNIKFQVSALALAAGLSACASTSVELERFEYSRLCMGVEARIVLHAANKASAERAADAAFARLAALDAALSDWNPQSELSRAVAGAAAAPVKISADLEKVLARALDVSRRTDGAFDPTLGPLTELWRAARTSKVMPTDAEIAAARARTGVQHVVLDTNAHTLRLAQSGMRLDFGGIAKGYACEQAVNAIAQLGIDSALVGMGGDYVCSAPPPDREGWRIALEKDGPAILLAQRAVSISGDSEQFVEIGGRRFSHVIDPKTGLGLENHARVIVIGPNGATCDALATALSVRGGEAALELARRFIPVEVRLEETQAGSRVVRDTPGFAGFLEK